MAQNTQNGAEAAPAAAAEKTKGKPPIMIIVVVLVALLAGGLGAKLLFAKGSAKPKVEAPKVGESLPLDEFLLNLADDGNDHYVKTTIALGLKEGVSSEKFKEKVPAARDAIVMLLSSKHLDDVRSEAGKTKLKAEIKAGVNKSVGEDDVVDVYFQAFATQ